MRRGAVPNQAKVILEYRLLLKTLRAVTTVKVLPFAKNLDTDGLYCHDFVYTRDSFISNLRGEVMVSNFSERQRQPEAAARKIQLQQLGYKIAVLPGKVFAEGGEFLYSPKDSLLFCGQSRNNALGNRLVARFLGVKDYFTVMSEGYHLDTVMALAKDRGGRVKAALVCWDRIKNQRPLAACLMARKIPTFTVDPVDSIGNGVLGTLAINFLALPGVIVGGDRFQTRGLAARLKALGIKHLVTPVSQFTGFSGGSVHCLTNEL